MDITRSQVFTNNTLRKAVDLWCEDRNTALLLYGNITHWDTSNVTDMSTLFCYKCNFNDMLEWDTSNVTNMSRMFNCASSFNQSLHFNTSNVTDMYYMFAHAISFNQPLHFDTSNVTNMNSMFYNTTSFNQPLYFNTSKVTDMMHMFCCAKCFNQYLEFEVFPSTDCICMFARTPIHTLYGITDIRDPKYALLKYRENHKYVVWLSANDSPDKDNMLYALPTDITRYMCGYLITK